MFVGKHNFASYGIHVMSVAAVVLIVSPGNAVLGQQNYEYSDVNSGSAGMSGHSVFTSEYPTYDEVMLPDQQPFFRETMTGLRHRNNDESGILPSGLLYRSYIAAPHESRFATILNYNISKGDWRWDSTLGGRVGLFRQNQPAIAALDVWQIDLEGAALPRLDPQLQMDVESIDYRFGLLWTARQDNVAFKFGYFHISSHVGDEFLSKNPDFQRDNFVRESLIVGSTLNPTPNVRLYGEFAWAFAYSGGARPLQFQLGAEHTSLPDSPGHGAPFSAVNLQLRQEVNYAAGVTAMSGWQWTGPDSGRTMRVGLHYYNGPTNQFEFFRRYDNQIGTGVWFDY